MKLRERVVVIIGLCGRQFLAITHRADKNANKIPRAMVNRALFTSNTDEWSTPQDLFDRLNERLHFGFDLAASKENAKCDKFFTREDDALSRDWIALKPYAPLWLNPPYGRDIGKWVEKAYDAYDKAKVTIVMLLPARTDTAWFQDYIIGKHAKVAFLRGRLKFGGSKNAAPFPSVLVYFKNS